MRFAILSKVSLQQSLSSCCWKVSKEAILIQRYREQVARSFIIHAHHDADRHNNFCVLLTYGGAREENNCPGDEQRVHLVSY